MDIIFEDTIIHVMASHFPAGNNFHDIYISDKVACLFAPKKPSIIMMRVASLNKCSTRKKKALKFALTLVHVPVSHKKDCSCAHDYRKHPAAELLGPVVMDCCMNGSCPSPKHNWCCCTPG